jgi:hypothetical protein
LRTDSELQAEMRIYETRIEKIVPNRSFASNASCYSEEHLYNMSLYDTMNLYYSSR